MNRLKQSDEELLIKVNEVLHYLWDPIGVAGIIMARDEYDSYVPQVFSLLKKNAEEEEIANFLTCISVDRMGLKKNSDHDKEIAKTLIGWKAYCEKRMVN